MSDHRKKLSGVDDSSTNVGMSSNSQAKVVVTESTSGLEFSNLVQFYTLLCDKTQL